AERSGAAAPRHWRKVQTGRARGVRWLRLLARSLCNAIIPEEINHHRIHNQKHDKRSDGNPHLMIVQQTTLAVPDFPCCGCLLHSPTVICVLTLLVPIRVGQLVSRTDQEARLNEQHQDYQNSKVQRFHLAHDSVLTVEWGRAVASPPPSQNRT